jgi:cytochrome c-type biogenesis protein CcmH/NrfF
MEHDSLSVGGHLLLWVFPLLLTILVVADSVRDWRRGRL